jgi:hypothetical protein
MGYTRASSGEAGPNGDRLEQDPLEVIRCASADAQRRAIRVLLDRGMLNFTSQHEEEWLVRTPVERKLRNLGVPFEWLTEHA